VILEQLKKEGRVATGNLECISRKTSASTAVGKKKKHDEEQIDLLNRLFST
jgi:2-oxoglutarate dehydrogenase complex dehydrogenase (E1) component-like enzyme